MRKFYVLTLLLICGRTGVDAQVTVTGATGAGNGSYSTLAAACTAIVAAQPSANIVISITGNTTEPVGGATLVAGSWTTLTIQPSGGAARTITGATTAGLPLLKLNGADNVTINGLNTGGNSLSFSNTTASGTAGTSTIQFINDASNNLVTNCTILGSSITALATAGGTVVFSTGTAGNGNDNNTVSNNNIGPAGSNLPTKAIMGLGSSGNNDNELIDNNNIYDFFLATTSVSGIYLNNFNSGWTISNNKIYQTATRTFTTTAGLRYAGITLAGTAGSVGSFTLTGNTIGFINASGTGVTTITGTGNGLQNEVRGIDAATVSTSTATSIQGNIISGITQSSSRNLTAIANSAFVGISLGAGSFNCGNTTGNTIGSLNASSAITITESSTTDKTTGIMGILDMSSNSNNISNNNIGTVTISSGATGGSHSETAFSGIYVSTATGLTETINNNTIGGTATGSITNTSTDHYAMNGIDCELANASMTGNIIRNISGNSGSPGPSELNGLVSSGIILNGSTGVNTVSQNSIYNLSNTNSGHVIIYGMSLTLPSAANIIERNQVYGLSMTGAADANNKIYGIFCGAAGTATYKNNMISLGYDAAGASITTGYDIEGIYENTGCLNNYYFNSVYIAGTGVVSKDDTYCFNSDVTTGTRVIEDNIFWNARSNASGSNNNYALGIGGTVTTGLTTNYNDLYVSGTGGLIGIFNGHTSATLTVWRTAPPTGIGQEAQSLTVTPQFISNTDLHLSSGNNCGLNGSGLTIGSITIDIDGDTRGAPPIMGADEFASTFLVITNPSTGCGSVDLTASAVTAGSTAGSTLSYWTDAAATLTLSSPNAVSVANTYYIKAVNGTCSSIKPVVVTMNATGQWLGVDNNWSNAANWCGGVPTKTTNVLIPAGLTKYPTISTGTAFANNITINAGTPNGSFTVSGTGILSLHGTITNNGTLDLTAGTLKLAGSSQVISGGSFLSRTIKNLMDSTSASLSATANDTLNITGNLSFANTSGSVTFTTNDNLTLKSSASGTASVNDITNAGTTSNTISGNVNVERYISTGRKWRFIAVNTGGTQTIKSSWMENQTPGQNSGPAGRGLWITDPRGTAGGFDASSGVSMMYWDTTTAAYKPIDNPTTYQIGSKSPYMTFVRGDRGAQIAGATTAGGTVVRTKGTLNQNSYPVSGAIAIPANHATIALGNPYASAVDLTKVITMSSGQVVNIQVWDPLLAGSSGVGGFQYLTRNPVTYPDLQFHVLSPGGYSYPAAGSIVNSIESGQGFFLQGSTLSLSCRFTEQSKTPGVNQVFFTAGHPESIFGSLSILDATGNTVVDGFTVAFNDAFNSAADFDDAIKRLNTNENISVKTDNILLAADLRQPVSATGNDTVHLNMTGMRQMNYEWNINADNMDEPGRTAFLIDQFTHTETALNLAGSSPYDFTVTGAAASFAADRFLIVFRPNTVLPVTLTGISATRQADKTILVKWNTENEINIADYEVQRSGNGSMFNVQGSRLPISNNGTSALYSFTDNNPLGGDNYYRIKAISNNGQLQYSAIVKVGPVAQDASITVYPNPLMDKMMNVHFTNKAAGKYSFQLVNKAGQTIFTDNVTVTGANEVKTETLNSRIAAGGYQLIIRSDAGEKVVVNVVVE